MVNPDKRTENEKAIYRRGYSSGEKRSDGKNKKIITLLRTSNLKQKRLIALLAEEVHRQDAIDEKLRSF
jgi:hypothetical protein